MFNYLGQGNSFGANKEDLIEVLSDYYNNLYDLEFIDDETLEEVKTNREKALATLRRLKLCGWIFEEDDANYEVKINFTHYSIPIIQVLSDIKHNKELEYQGYIFLIYSALKHIETDTLGDMVDQIYDNTHKVMNRLKSLNSNIKKYIQELLNKKDISDLKSIVENLFIDYKKNIIDDAYQRLKTSDNVSKYRPFIISKLNEICVDQDLINSVAIDLVSKKRFQTISEAVEDLYFKMDYIINSFENLDNIIEEIDRKNSKYIQTSISKILFIVNNTVDLQGKINSILRYCVEVSKDQQPELGLLSQLFLISTQKNLDTASMYTQPQKMMMSLQKLAHKKSLTKEEKQKRLDKFIKNNVFSKKSINKYVQILLKGKKKIKASQIPISTYEDYTKLILIYMYSNSIHINYRISKLETIYCQNDYHFVDFDIWGK